MECDVIAINFESFVKIIAICCGMVMPNIQPIVVIIVAKIIQIYSVFFTLSYCRAPKLYPNIGCIP